MTSSQFGTTIGSARCGKGVAGKFGPSCSNFGGIDDLAFPLQGGNLVHQGVPVEEGCMGSLGDIQLMDLLAKLSTRAMLAIMVLLGTQAESWVQLLVRWHHIVCFPIEDQGAGETLARACL